METPDNWVILKITNEDRPHYKVLAGWYGGYTGSDSWKLNSGITDIIEEGDYYLFRGFSGSTYKCHKEGEGLRGMTGSILNQLKDKFGDKVELIYATDMNEEYML